MKWSSREGGSRLRKGRGKNLVKKKEEEKVLGRGPARGKKAQPCVTTKNLSSPGGEKKKRGKEGK